MADYKAHAEDITGIILYAYEIDNGTLAPNPRFPPGQCVDHFADWKATGIDIFAAINMKVGPILKSPETEQRFIDDAVGMALKHGLKGYNADHEGSATGPPEYLKFLNKFADALHAHGMTLTSDVDGCPQGCEGISCHQYQQSKVDQVLLMSWYHGGTGLRFIDKVLNTTKLSSLGPAKTMAGWAGTHWMHNCSIMDFVLEQGISSVGYWCSSMSPQNWALLHDWMTIDPQHPHPNRPCWGPPGTPFYIKRGGACVTTPNMTERAPIGLGECGGPTSSWTSGTGAMTLSGTEWCASVVSTRKGHSPCDPMALGTLALKDAQCLGHSFTFDSRAGTLVSSVCPGLCAGAPRPAMHAEVHHVDGNVKNNTGLAHLMLMNCSDVGATGFTQVFIHM